MKICVRDFKISRFERFYGFQRFRDFGRFWKISMILEISEDFRRFQGLQGPITAL